MSTDKPDWKLRDYQVSLIAGLAKEARGGGKTVIAKQFREEFPVSEIEIQRADEETAFQRKFAELEATHPVLDEVHHHPGKRQDSNLSGESLGTWPTRQNPVPDPNEPKIESVLTVSTNPYLDFVARPRSPLIPGVDKFLNPSPAVTLSGNQLGRLAQQRLLERRFRIMYQQASRRKKLLLKKFAKTNNLEECIAYAKRVHFFY
jgi:hypothetical protein